MHQFHASNSPVAPPIKFEEFQKVDVRIGTIVGVDAFPEARSPAFKLRIDFGATLGIKKSSAQITANYTPETLIGKKIACVVNFPPRQIGKFLSHVLVLGFPDSQGNVVLFSPDKEVENGARLF